KYNGFLINISARLGRGVQFQGGINSGKTVQDNCAGRPLAPELTTTAGASPATTVANPNCHADPGFITKATALGSYTIPKVDVLVSGTLRSDQGGVLTATWNAPVGAALAGGGFTPGSVSAALGRAAAVTGTTVPITLVKPGE